MPIQKIKSGRVNIPDIESYIGDNGIIFFDELLGELRLGDGITPGGIPLTMGGGGGGGYVLPTATTSVKGGVKIDGSTIIINNQIISVGTVPYSSISGTPTIPNNTNQLTNGAGYITSSALSGYATETFVTTRGYLTAVSWNDVQSKPSFATVATSGSYTDLTNRPTLFSGSYTDLTNKPSIPTDINQLTDASGLLGQGGGGTTYVTNNVENPYAFNVAADDSTLREISNGETLRFQGATGITITSDTEGKITITGPDLSAYATETFVTTRGYLTSVSWDDVQSKPTFATVATSGSYTDLINKPTIPTDISQLTDSQGLLNSAGGTAVITNPYSFKVAADDSTQREIVSGETVRFQGATGITTTSDEEGKITITGPDLSSYATQTYVNTQGYITGSALAGYATETYVATAVNNLINGAPQILDTLQELAASLNNDGNAVANLVNEINKKANISDLVLTIAGDDSTERVINIGEGIRLQGTGSITITTDAEGKLTINGAATDLTGYATETFVTTQGYITSSALTGYATENYVNTRGYLTTVSWNDLTDKPNLAGTFTFFVAADDSTQRQINSDNLVKFIGGTGITTSSDTDGNITLNGFSGSYNDLTDKPSSSALNANGTLSMPFLTAEPANLAAGQIALANGTSWDPLLKGESKPYLTIYTGSIWIDIGGLTNSDVYKQILELG